MTEEELKKALANKVFAEDEKYSYIEDAQKGLISAIGDLNKFRNILCVRYKVYSITDLDAMIGVCKSLVEKTGELLRVQSIRVEAMKELSQVSPVVQTVPVIEMKTPEEKPKEAAPKAQEAKPTEVVSKASVEKTETVVPSESPEEKKTTPGLEALQKRRELARKAKGE